MYHKSTPYQLFIRPLIFGAIVGSIIGLIIGDVIQKHQIVNTQKTLVYAICQESRMTINDGGSEQTCGDVQDRLNIEYLCAERNSLPDNKCWTETK